MKILSKLCAACAVAALVAGSATAALAADPVKVKTAWVAGLPKRVALITAGQGFVEAGQQVVARQAGQVN